MRDYKISKHAFYQAMHYAYRYSEFKKKVKDMSMIRAVQYTNSGKGNKISDPTQRAAIAAEEAFSHVERIEQTVMQTDPELYKWILEGVTNEDATFEYLAGMGIPCSRNTYYARRRKFYYLLSKKI